MTFTSSATFEAPPEIVFDTLTDPVGMPRWLPHEVTRNPVGQALLRVAQGTSGEPVNGIEQTLTAQTDVQLTFLPHPQAAFVASVTVVPLGSGGSSLDLSIEAQRDCAEDRIPALVDRTLTNLHREVADRFTTG